MPAAILLRAGFGAGRGGGFFKPARGLGIAGADSIEANEGLRPLTFGKGGAAADGGGGGNLGGAAEGILGAEEERCVSESEYED